MNTKAQGSIEMLFVLAAVIALTAYFSTTLYEEDSNTRALLTAKGKLLEQLNTQTNSYSVTYIQSEPLGTSITITADVTPDIAAGLIDPIPIENAVKNVTSFQTVSIVLN